MWNRYSPKRGGIRFFPHIVPLAFPLIFPLGIGLVIGLFFLLFSVLKFLLIAALVLFIIRAITLGSPGAAWNSMKNMGQQWQQRFTSQRRQPSYQPYEQPASSTGQEQSSWTYGQGYQPEQPSYHPAGQPNDFDQPQPQYPQQMPPMQQ